MNKKTLSLILKIIQIIISIALCIASTVSMLGATLITVARDYLQSEQFQTQIDTTDLGTVRFMMNGQKITINDYIRARAEDYIKDKMPTFSLFSNYAVDQLVSSQLVDTVLKSEVYSLVDYFLNTTVEDAQYRIDNNITLADNEDLNPENAESVEDAISIYARKYVLESIEDVAGMSTDSLIILISEETVSKLITLSVVLLVVLVAVNILTLFNSLIYGGIVSILYGIVIKTAQGKFAEMTVGKEDLVTYVFLKPLVDTYSSNATIAFIVGIVLILLFAGVILLLNYFVNKKESNKQ